MRQVLKSHPDAHGPAATHVEVDVVHADAGSLLLTYIVTGKIGDLRIAPIAAAVRTDELWRNTCFEAFVRDAPAAAYYEFNFAPSTQWAAYRFDGYRCGMRVATEIAAPQIAVQSEPACLRLQATLPLQALPRGARRHLGLAAVLEETNGRKSYWALAHPPGRPDFHHADCFALQLA